MSRKHVVASAKIEYASSRELVSGIFNRMDQGLDWKFEFALSADELRERIAAAKRGEGADGFIVSAFLEPDIVRSFAALELPVITVGVHDSAIRARKAPTVEIHNDGHAIGHLAASYVSKLGRFASRGYVHVHSGRSEGYSDERLAGFGKTEVFESPYPEGSTEDSAALGEFLLALPKPAAVLAAHDKRALDVLELAGKLGLKVPKELSVLGIDNDTLFCSHCTPPLTSVHPGHFEMGFKAADELERMFNARKPLPSIRLIKVPPRRIVERESTHLTPSAEELVQRAREYIAENACNGIGPKDVAGFLHCSRSLLDLRFRERTGTTLRQMIENERLKHVKRLLKTSKRSLTAIAAQCGFSSECRLSHLFTQRFGASPRVWRKLQP